MCVLINRTQNLDFQVKFPLVSRYFNQSIPVELNEVLLSESKENKYSEDISSLLSEMSKVRVKRVQRIKSILKAVKGRSLVDHDYCQAAPVQTPLQGGGPSKFVPERFFKLLQKKNVR